MSSKMLAGLVAGGFGAALSIGLTLSAHFSPQLAYFLALALLFGLGALSGVLAAAWLDLPDYGRQQAAGAITGLVAASLTEVCDLILRLVFASISSASPTSVLANLLVSLLPAPDDVARILFMVIVNLLLYLVYLLIVIGISGAVASLVGRAKSAEALQALLDAQQHPLPRDPLGKTWWTRPCCRSCARNILLLSMKSRLSRCLSGSSAARPPEERRLTNHILPPEIAALRRAQCRPMSRILPPEIAIPSLEGQRAALSLESRARLGEPHLALCPAGQPLACVHHPMRSGPGHEIRTNIWTHFL